jgi:hypothetical protein
LDARAAAAVRPRYRQQANILTRECMCVHTRDYVGMAA